MTKFLYTYDVVRNDSGLKEIVYFGYEDKKLAEQIAVDAINNVPGRSFKVVQRRKLNPAYVTAEPVA
jgi:hypothetical protein